MVYKKELLENIPTWRNALWIFVYLAGLCIFYKIWIFGSGLKVIPEGIDYVLLAIFSVVIMYISKATMLPPEVAEKTSI